MNRTWTAFLLAVAVLGSGGCYGYRPVQAGSGATPGSEVRVYVAGAVGGSPATPNSVYGTANHGVFDGRLLRWEADSVVIGRSTLTDASGYFGVRTDTVSFPTPAVQRIERKELAKGRTAAITAAAVTVAVLLSRWLLGTGGGSLPSGPSGDPGALHQSDHSRTVEYAAHVAYSPVHG